MAETSLPDVPYFRSLDDETQQILLRLTRPASYPAGTVLFEPGQPRDRMQLIHKGSVEVYRPGATAEAPPLITYGPGDVLGEGMLINDTTHATLARTASAIEVLELERGALHEAIKENPDLERSLLSVALQMIITRYESMARGGAVEAMQIRSGDMRREHDLIGDRDVPAHAYYGVQTVRALENFRITRTPISHYPALIRALAMVKLAAAEANCDCGVLKRETCDAMVAACEEIIAGKWHQQFAIDVVQGGAGTSTNMNANEVIANRALEILGHDKGEYKYCHPNNDVNRSQSTNDVYPSALKLAMAIGNIRLVTEIRELVEAFRAKSVEFQDYVKMGRTQLQDAVPMTLGQEFEAFARTLENEISALELGSRGLLYLNMGGTAIGTGLNAPPNYSQHVIKHLRAVSGLDLELGQDLIEATQDTQAFVLYSSVLKSLAIKLSKISNDLRLLSSGPRAGLGDIQLPPRQPGSSIMPGKVNPVIPEVVNQVCFKVIGNDLTITMAAEAGQLQLNAMEPIIAACNLESVSMLFNASSTLRRNCVSGITADQAALREQVERNTGLVTALVPYLGYEISTELAGEAQRSGRGIVELVRERGLLDEQQIADMLSPDHMTKRSPQG